MEIVKAKNGSRVNNLYGIQVNDIRRRNEKQMLIWALLFSLIPDIGIKFRFMGLTWNAYRVFCLVAVIYLMVHFSGTVYFGVNKFNDWLLLLLSLWVIYGMTIMIISQYSDRHKGFIELLALVNGLILCGIVRYAIKSTDDFDIINRVIYLVLVFFVLYGIYEIVTGNHWYASAFNDEGSTIANYDNIHLATGFMYNMNDFSAMITCISPVLISKKLGKLRWCVLAGVFFINLINDATTCNIAMILFFIYYYMLVAGKINYRILKWELFVLICIISVAFIFYQGEGLTSRSDVLGAVARQVFNARNSTGSLYRRVIIYQDSLQAIFGENILGFGPCSFENFFTLHPSASKLVNPHSLLIEILFQYGMIIFIPYVLLLFLASKRTYLEYKRCNDNKSKPQYMIYFGFIICYILVSFAPSSYLNYSYQWLLVGIICRSLDISREKGGGRKLCLM